MKHNCKLQLKIFNVYIGIRYAKIKLSTFHLILSIEYIFIKKIISLHIGKHKKEFIYWWCLHIHTIVFSRLYKFFLFLQNGLQYQF